ncbi:hypothetical protein WP12_16705 [Sphingomonas sp. SRS2]|nr:hypothetical protein WP12_16705 [Sphingomonas sp. SRS2]
MRERIGVPTGSGTTRLAAFSSPIAVLFSFGDLRQLIQKNCALNRPQLTVINILRQFEAAQLDSGSAAVRNLDSVDSAQACQFGTA